MKISVIIPCRNAGPWIGEALVSVARQTYQPYEVIVIDDGSTDNSLDEVKRTGIATHILHTNLANAAAVRNTGVRQASGDWIAFLDADDVWYSHHLATMTQLLTDDRDVAFMGHHDALDENTGATIARAVPCELQTQGGLSHHDFYRLFVNPNRGWPTSSMVILKKRFWEAGAFDEAQVRRHDADMFMRVIHGCKWGYAATPTWAYRIRTCGNISSNQHECAYYLLRALLKNYHLYPGSDMARLIRKQARKAMSLNLLAGNANDFDRCAALALEHMGVLHRVFYRTASRWPRPVKLALQWKHAIHRAA